MTEVDQDCWNCRGIILRHDRGRDETARKIWYLPSWYIEVSSTLLSQLEPVGEGSRPSRDPAGMPRPDWSADNARSTVSSRAESVFKMTREVWRRQGNMRTLKTPNRSLEHARRAMTGMLECLRPHSRRSPSDTGVEMAKSLPYSTVTATAWMPFWPYPLRFQAACTG